MGARRDRKPYYDEEPVIGGAVKYHRESCWAVGMIGASQKRLKSWKEALQLGLQPCGVCKPFGYELWKASQPSEKTAGAAPALLALEVAAEESAPDNAAESVISRDSIFGTFQRICETLKEIAAGHDLQVDPRITSYQIIELLARHDKANFPAWFVSMLHFMRQLRNRVAHPPKVGQVTEKQIAAWRACFEVFEEWSHTWGWKR